MKSEEAVMDQKNPPSAGESNNVFTVAEYEADPRRVYEHAHVTGCAVVTAADGRELFAISVLTEDLPPFV